MDINLDNTQGEPTRPNTHESERLRGNLEIYLDQMGEVDLLTTEQEFALAEAIQAGRIAAVSKIALNGIGAVTEKQPILSPELDQEIQEGRKAARAFGAANLRLVVAAANKVRELVPQHAFTDVLQDMNITLLRLVNNFDPTKGWRFASYAVPVLDKRARQCASKYFKNLPMYVPEGAAKDINRISRAEQEILQTYNGLEPSLEAIAEKIDVSTERVKELRRPALLTAFSIDAPLTFGSILTLEEVLADGEMVPEDIIELESWNPSEILSMAYLTEREVEVMTLLYTPQPDGSLPNKTDIAHLLGVSRQAVSLSYVTAIKKLRAAMGLSV